VAQRVVQQVFAAVATLSKVASPASVSASARHCAPQASAKNGRLLSLATSFVGAMMVPLRATSHALHKPFMRLFAKIKAKLPAHRVPLVQSLFCAARRTQRQFALRYLASGAVRDAGDVLVLMRHRIVTFLLHFIPSSGQRRVARADAYTVLLALSRVPEGAASDADVPRRARVGRVDGAHVSRRRHAAARRVAGGRRRG
jgi:hypothetical protein